MNNNNEPKTDGSSYVTVGTKIDRVMMERLRRFCEATGTTPYSVIQYAVEMIVRYCDSPTDLSPEMAKMMTLFEGMIGWKDSFNLADPAMKPDIVEATYYLKDERIAKGVRCVHVSKPYFGTPVYTLNTQEMLEQMVCVNFPGLYRRLRAAATELETGSVLETVLTLVNDYLAGRDEREMSEIFGDNQRSEYGRKAVDAPFVRHHRREMDDLFETTDLDSCPDDVPLPDCEDPETCEDHVVDVDDIIASIENGTL